MDKNIIKKLLRLIFVDFLIYGILYFPFWWYSLGLYKVLQKCSKIIINSWDSLGIDIQIRYLFAPMYGQQDFTGKAISFAVRIFMLIFKSIYLLFIFLICSFLLVLWISLPIIVIYSIVLNYKFLTQK